MRTSPAGRAFIGRHEGLRLSAYRDAAGIWTIGYGHTAAAGPPVPVAGLTITAAEADAILGRDLARFEAAVARLVTAALSQDEFDALVSFAFNVGEGALGRSTLLKKLNAGDRAGAAVEFGRWNKAGGRVLAGLTRRRAEERAMFEGGGVEVAAEGAGMDRIATPAVEPAVAVMASAPAPSTVTMSQPQPVASRASVPSVPGRPEPAPTVAERVAGPGDTATGEPVVAGKPALASKAVWGGLIAVAAALLPVLGPAAGLDEAGQGQVLETLAALGGVIGGLVAIWGRLAARAPIR
jgi:lysozyme